MGAEIEARDYRGRTPLLLAAELGNDNNLNNFVIFLRSVLPTFKFTGYSS